MDARTLKRFESKVARDQAGHCWVWTGSLSPEGYGRLRVSDHNRYAHRLSFEHYVGPLPVKPLVLDHLCRNRACVNPEHLEIVTELENIRRGEHVQRRVERCGKGHEYSGDNLYVKPNGARVCRECAKAAKLRHYHRHKRAATLEP